MGLKEKLKKYQKEGVQQVKLGFTDVDGVMRGKYISFEKFCSIADSESGFCDCVFGWDVNDQLYDNTDYTGWHTAFPDAKYRIDLSTERRLPDEGNIPFFLLQFIHSHSKDLHPICLRSLMRRVLKKADDMGFGLMAAFEYEFFVFNETPHTLRDKDFKNLTPLTPGNFGYSILRSSAESELFNSFMEYCRQMDFPLEGLHCETGPGVWEGAIAVDEAMNACDKASLFKTFTKVFFQKRQKMATFMAKWSMDYPGQSGHMHQSLIHKKTGRNVFYNKKNENSMSDTMRHYLGGMQTYLKPFLAMTAPTINSYTRLVKGAWAPTTASWGIENRTTALRVIPGSQKSQRIEYRIGSADANPYLTAAACLGAGLLGIEKKLEPGPAVTGNAYEAEDSMPAKYRLPSNLKDSIENFAKSKEAADLFGSEFQKHFTASREWEVREYEKAVNDWQLKRYFEII